ncbi:hypothetical protein BGZ52_003708, partial [Haplosporangium bisporale]
PIPNSFIIPMPQKLAEIPELLEHISRYLWPQDLLYCIQVSSQWHSIFIPSLWHTIDDGDHLCDNPFWTILNDSDKDEHRIWLKSQLADTPSFTVSASMFPELSVASDFVALEIGEFGTNALDESSQVCLEQMSIFNQHYWHLVSSNLQLERLTFAGSLRGWELDDISGIWPLLAAVPTIEHLTSSCYLSDKFPEHAS